MLARHPFRPGRGRAAPRRGSAIVEFAVVAPVLISLVFGIIEIGRLVMLSQMATNAAREGSRYAVQGTASAATVDAYLRTYLASAGLRNAPTGAGSSVAVAVEAQAAGVWADTPDPSAVSSGTPVRVTVTIDYAKESWLPTTFFLGGTSKVQGCTVMRRE